jgi:hypothetical protein
MGADIVLLVFRDIHGAASIAGMMLAFFLVRQLTNRS